MVNAFTHIKYDYCNVNGYILVIYIYIYIYISNVLIKGYILVMHVYVCTTGC